MGKTGTASGVRITGYSTVTKSDSGLASALNNGAVTVLVYADSSFQHYSSGVLSSPPTTCSLNHAVLATGYGSNYWKIKNSWGSSWGEAGYIRFERTTAGCGLMVCSMTTQQFQKYLVRRLHRQCHQLQFQCQVHLPRIVKTLKTATTVTMSCSKVGV